MAWTCRCLGVCVVGLSAGLSGCGVHPDWALPEGRSLDTFMTDKQEPRVARLQTGAEGPPVGLKKPAPLLDLAPAPATPPAPAGFGVIPASASTRGSVRVSVRAWVNGHPIFDDEVMQMAGYGLSKANGLPGAQRAEEMAKVINTELNKIIDTEVIYQDAIRKLEKANPQALAKLKEYVDLEFDKSLARMRKGKVPEEEIRSMEAIARRMLERDLISMEYARSRILPIVLSRIGFQEIRDYYEAHKNEFVTVDKIVWQDIFIPISPTLPTIAAVKQFAEEAVNRCRTREDFDKLMFYNEGDSKLRGGEGLGNRRGEIRPAELEEHLFDAKEWLPGPVVAFANGVHLFRVTKRDYAGQLPLDEATQKTIRKELEKHLADREYRRIVRELRARAVVRIDRE